MRSSAASTSPNKFSSDFTSGNQGLEFVLFAREGSQVGIVCFLQRRRRGEIFMCLLQQPVPELQQCSPMPLPLRGNVKFGIGNEGRSLGFHHFSRETDV